MTAISRKFTDVEFVHLCLFLCSGDVINIHRDVRRECCRLRHLEYLVEGVPTRVGNFRRNTTLRLAGKTTLCRPSRWRLSNGHLTPLSMCSPNESEWVWNPLCIQKAENQPQLKPLCMAGSPGTAQLSIPTCVIPTVVYEGFTCQAQHTSPITTRGPQV
jgi:hypothetical protein